MDFGSALPASLIDTFGHLKFPCFKKILQPVLVHSWLLLRAISRMVEESTPEDLVLLRLCNQNLKWPIKNKNECIHVHIVCMSMYIDMIYIYTSLYVYIENMSIWNIIYSTIVCVYIYI